MRRFILVLAVVAMMNNPRVAAAESSGGWREEFARICARSGESGAYSEAELSKLIADSDRLRLEIANSKEPDSRVYLFRLDKCRAFFVFMKEATSQQ
ncbi:MAG: hypothetical protein HGA96_08320 [Desulfobulbaceae bacterium]|nr:hypothetical protein [Desulfobulbaceae bacterium]